MANLQTPGDVKHVSFSDLKPIDKVAGLWVVKLRSSSDLLTVPRLDSDTDYSVSSLTGDHTAAFYSSSRGESLIQVTGGSLGEDAVVATLHRQGLSNNLTLRRGTNG